MSKAAQRQRTKNESYIAARNHHVCVVDGTDFGVRQDLYGEAEREGGLGHRAGGDFR